MKVQAGLFGCVAALALVSGASAKREPDLLGTTADGLRFCYSPHEFPDSLKGADGMVHRYTQAYPPQGKSCDYTGVRPYGQRDETGRFVVPMKYGAVRMISDRYAVVQMTLTRPYRWAWLDLATGQETELKLAASFDLRPAAPTQDNVTQSIAFEDFSPANEGQRLRQMVTFGGVALPPAPLVVTTTMAPLSGEVSPVGRLGDLYYVLQPRRAADPLIVKLYTEAGAPVLADRTVALGLDGRSLALVISAAPDQAHLPGGYVFLPLQSDGQPAPLAAGQVGVIWLGAPSLTAAVDTADVFYVNGQVRFRMNGRMYSELTIASADMPRLLREDGKPLNDKVILGRMDDGKWRAVALGSRPAFATVQEAVADVGVAEQARIQRANADVAARRRAGDRMQLIADFNAHMSRGPNGDVGDGRTLREKALMLGDDYLVRYAKRYGAADPEIVTKACAAGDAVDCGQIKRMAESAQRQQQLADREAAQPQFKWSDAAANAAINNTIAGMAAFNAAQHAQNSAIAARDCSTALSGANTATGGCH